MNRLFLLLLLLLPQLLAAQSPSPSAPQPLTGTVLDQAGRPLPGVNVFLKTTFDGATTDSAGRFAFRTSRIGPLALVFTLVGYEPQEVALSLTGQPVQLPSRRLRESRQKLADVVVTAGAFEASDEKRSAALKPLDIVTTAGALGDVAGALNSLPGTTRNPESGQLFVRGGAAGETKTYLDGLPVQAPYGGSVPGSVPARGRFSPFLFKGTVFSTGAYSAEYGQALSAVVGLNSTDLAPETTTGVSLMSVGGSLSHTRRWDKTSAALTFDYVNLAPYYGLVPQQWQWSQAPEQHGGSLKVARQTGAAGGMLKAYATWSHQQLGFGQPAADNAAGLPVALRNDNFYLNTSYRTPLRGAWSLNTGLALGRERNRVQPGLQTVDEREQTAVGRLVVTADPANARYNLKTGLELYAQRYDLAYQAAPETDVLRPAFAERRASFFAESDLSLSRRLTARAGGRAEYSAVLGRANAAPRLALALQTGAHAQLSAAYGQFYQTPANDLLRLGPPAAGLRFEQAAHYLLSFQRAVAERTLRAEAYYKDYQHLVRYALDPATQQPTNPVSAGSGYARGLDLFWRDRKSVKYLDYWVSYGFLDTKRQFRADPALAVPTFAAAHNLSVVTKYWVPKIHTQIGLTYAYSSPRAYFNPNLPGYNQGRTPSYQDLSLSFSYLTTIARQFTVVYVSVSNVLGRQNVFGYRYAAQPDPATGQYAGVVQQPSAPRMLFVGVFVNISKKKADTNTAPE